MKANLSRSGTTKPGELFDRHVMTGCYKALNDPQGRLFLFWLLERCGVNSPNVNVGNSLLMAHCEGKRTVGLLLQNMLMAIDSTFLQRIMEQVSETKTLVRKQAER